MHKFASIMLGADVNRIRDYLAMQPVSKAWLFGSYARNEQTSSSDVDILVKFDSGVSLLKHASMVVDLEDMLMRRVDLVADGTLCDEVVPFVDRDKVLIYERGA